MLVSLQGTYSEQALPFQSVCMGSARDASPSVAS